MNRNTIVAMSVAAVLGTTGGVALAVNQSDRDTTTASSNTPTPMPSPTAKDPEVVPSESPAPTTDPTPPPSGTDDSTNEPLLWANKRVLHDGNVTVKLNLRNDVENVVRMAGGWVVAERNSPQEASYRMWWVTPDSTPSRFATVVGAWDADPTGKYIVGQGDDTKVTVWTPETGAARSWDSKQEGPTYSGFQGDKVLISMENKADGYGWQMFLWDPATGETTDPKAAEGGQAGDTVAAGYPHMTVSPGGSYLTGTTFPDGTPDPDMRCLHLESTNLKKNSVTWDTCDWMLYGIQGTFSPDGTRLLAVDRMTDGFGPGGYGVIDASDGPQKMVANVRTGDYTVRAEWADNDHLYVIRASDGDASNGYAIERCDFDSKCTKVATSKFAPAVGTTR